jgi:hypothetical protein
MRIAKQIPESDADIGERREAADERAEGFPEIEVLEDQGLSAAEDDPLDEALWGDPVNLRFPLAYRGDTEPDRERSSNARSRFKGPDGADAYERDETKGVVHTRIVQAEIDAGVEPGYDPQDPLDRLLSPQVKRQLGVEKMHYGDAVPSPSIPTHDDSPEHKLYTLVERHDRYPDIAILDGMPAARRDEPLCEDLWGDPVNLIFPLAGRHEDWPNAIHANTARECFKDEDSWRNAMIYPDDLSRACVHERIVRAQIAAGMTPEIDPEDPLDCLLPADLLYGASDVDSAYRRKSMPLNFEAKLAALAPEPATPAKPTLDSLRETLASLAKSADGGLKDGLTKALADLDVIRKAFDSIEGVGSFTETYGPGGMAEPEMKLTDPDPVPPVIDDHNQEDELAPDAQFDVDDPRLRQREIHGIATNDVAVVPWEANARTEANPGRPDATSVIPMVGPSGAEFAPVDGVAKAFGDFEKLPALGYDSQILGASK